MKRNHMFWMIIGSTVPLLLIFLTPTFGMEENASLFLFVIAMLVIHLFMPYGHGKDQHNQSPTKETQNEKHQH